MTAPLPHIPQEGRSAELDTLTVLGNTDECDRETLSRLLHACLAGLMYVVFVQLS